jgi:hypothetical protein
MVMYCLTKITKMDDGDSKNNQQAEKQGKQTNALQRYGINAGVILQSIWVRCRSIFPTATDGKFMESELRFVLYCGILFWTLYLVYEAIK